MIKSHIRGLAIAAVSAAFTVSGQAQEVSGTNPAYTYANIMPSGFNPAGLGGLDFIGNDGFIATWGGSQKNLGELWMIPGLATATPGTPVKLDSPLREALGLRAIDGVLYVLTKPEIFKYTKGSNGTWTKSSLAKGWAYTDSQWHHFAFSLVYQNNSLYFNTGVAYEPDVNEDPQRGSTIKVNIATGAFEALVKGLRNANGLGAGPDGELFTTDNQGHWVPTNKLMHIKQGRFYGYRTNKNYTAGTTVETPPAIWLPYGNPGFSNSPTRLHYLKDGPYAGQMIAGDVFHGGIQRYFLEKVGGEYQGACFRFSWGIPYGVNEIVKGPDGNLYTAGIGGGCCGMDGSNNWNYNGKNNGLGRLTPTTTVPFDIRAVRSVQGGFELEFTKPVGTAANTASNFAMQSWWYQPTSAYGGSPVGTAQVQVSSAQLSDDKLKVKIALANSQVNKVYYFKLSNITSEAGDKLWTNEAWYTQLRLGPGDPVSVSRQVESFQSHLPSSLKLGANSLHLPFTAPYRVALMGIDGKRLAEVRGTAPGSLDLRGVSPGLYVLAGNVGSELLRAKIRVP